MLCYMFYCLVHVSIRKPHVQWPIWWKRRKFQFSLLNFNFLFFQFYPSFTFTFHPQISLFSHQTCPWPFSFSLKPSPLQNHHHLRRSTLDFWRKNSVVVKATSFLFFFFFFVRFHPFFVHFFDFSFSVFIISFSTLNIIWCLLCCLFVSVVFLIQLFRLFILGFSI